MRKPKRYIHGLDGLRAISVIAVILYHLNYPIAAGGYLGVTLFFVLSGYLITDLLFQEYQATNQIDFKQFWIRRFRRLLPALYTLLIVVVVWITLFQRSFLTGLREDVFAAIAYVSNWWYIAQDQSYFTKFDAPSVLQHLWSLAVEEQFYIVWPVLVWLGLKAVKEPSRLLLPMTAIMLASLVAMVVMYVPGEDPSRLYFGTDTRLFSIVLGGMLAVLWPSQLFTERMLQRRIRTTFDIIGSVALVAIIASFIFVGEDMTWLYRGGMGAISLVMAVVIAVVVIPDSYLSKVLSIRPLRWVGERSYGIYLWHFPIIILLGGGLGTPLPWPKAVLAVILTFICTVLSWRLVEVPVRYGGLGKLKSFYRNNYKTRKVRLQLMTMAVVLAVFTSGMVVAKSQSAAAAELQYHLEQAAAKQAKVQAKLEKEAKEKALQEAQAEKEEQEAIAAAQQEPTHHVISAIGDSVLLASSEALQSLFTTSYVDAAVGRQVGDATIVIDWMASYGRLGDIVVIALGSNGPFPEGEIDHLIEKIGSERQIFFVNTNVARHWKESVNTTIAKAEMQYDNVHIVDWDKAVAKKDDVFYEDGIHPNQQGAKYYAETVKSTIESVVGKVQ